MVISHSYVSLPEGTILIITMMIHGLDPSMENAARQLQLKHVETAQVVGFPRRTALYKHYAQADVTWLVLRPP
jgi:ABC-type spermidine/putrescine transport system permease subunit II